MPKSVFISYSRAQGDWVFDRLIPLLQAAGIEIFVDRERFKAGRPLIPSMEEWQDKADINVLVFSPDYLESEYCQHEMNRAIRRDPKFAKGIIIPVMRAECVLPPKIKKANPLFVDLAPDREAEPWKKLLEACEGSLGTCPREWLSARDSMRKHLEKKESVNLVVSGGASWRQLIEHLHKDRGNDLGLVDLQNPATFSRKGLVQAILSAAGSTMEPPEEPADLMLLGDVIESRKLTRIALTHFDLIARRSLGNKDDLFCALRYWLMETRKLVLLVQSREPFNRLVSADHPLSPISLKIVELKEQA